MSSQKLWENMPSLDEAIKILKLDAPDLAIDWVNLQNENLPYSKAWNDYVTAFNILEALVTLHQKWMDEDAEIVRQAVDLEEKLNQDKHALAETAKGFQTIRENLVDSIARREVTVEQFWAKTTDMTWYIPRHKAVRVLFNFLESKHKNFGYYINHPESFAEAHEQRMAVLRREFALKDEESVVLYRKIEKARKFQKWANETLRKNGLYPDLGY